MTSNEIATVQGQVAVQGQGALTLRGSQDDWTEAQRAALAQIGLAEAPRGDQLVLLHVSQRMGLDPFAKEIYMIGRWDPEAGRKKWAIQVGIDGFRSKSEEHPQFAGVDDAEWCGEDGVWRDVWLSDSPPVAARFTVYRKDWDRPARAVAHYREYVQTKKGGDPTYMWETRPAGQLAKCAEALARRRAFPRVLGGVHATEEMEHLDNPQPPMVIESEREAPAEPDWDALIAHHESAGELAALGETWKLARGMRPNDGALLDRIAAAAERVKATPTQGEESPGPTGDTPAEKSQTNRLFALLRDGAVSGKDRDVRLRIVSRILNRVPAVGSFDELSAADVETVNYFLQRQKNDGALTHTLADLAAVEEN